VVLKTQQAALTHLQEVVYVILYQETIHLQVAVNVTAYQDVIHL
jgi:hypothetical protein